MKWLTTIVHNKYGMSSIGEGMECEVIDRLQRSTLKWFDHIQKNARE